MMPSILKNNKGYTLLFAVLVSSVVLAIGISILTISKKEFLLSSSARESTSAFYAADSGLECAIFFSGNFSTTTKEAANLNCMKRALAYGNGIAFTATPANPTAPNAQQFSFDIKMPSGTACAVVTMQLYYQNDPDEGYIPRTTIESRGYNIGWDTNYSGPNKCSSPNSASARRVERALRYTF